MIKGLVIFVCSIVLCSAGVINKYNEPVQDLETAETAQFGFGGAPNGYGAYNTGAFSNFGGPYGGYNGGYGLGGYGNNGYGGGYGYGGGLGGGLGGFGGGLGGLFG